MKTVDQRIYHEPQEEATHGYKTNDYWDEGGLRQTQNQKKTKKN